MHDAAWWFFWTAQAIGGVAVVLETAAFQLRSKEKILKTQFYAALVYNVHYLMLGAWTGAGAGLYVLLRNGVIGQKERKKRWAQSPFWLVLFTIIGGAVLYFSWQGYISILPVMSTALMTWALWQGTPSTIRWSFLTSCFLWLPYAVVVVSYASIVSCVLQILTTSYAIMRYSGRTIPVPRVRARSL